jgi:hypothetical protein
VVWKKIQNKKNLKAAILKDSRDARKGRTMFNREAPYTLRTFRPTSGSRSKYAPTTPSFVTFIVAAEEAA